MRITSEGLYTNVISQVVHLTNLIVSYDEIKASSAMLTSAIDSDTIHGISYNRLADISRSLLDGSYRFAPHETYYGT